MADTTNDAERVQGEVTAAVERAGRGWWDWGATMRKATGHGREWDELDEDERALVRSRVRTALAPALDVPQMAAAIVDHLLTDTLPGDSETLVCACGHVLVTGDPEDDRDPQAEHATHHAALIRAAILGTDQ